MSCRIFHSKCGSWHRSRSGWFNCIGNHIRWRKGLIKALFGSILEWSISKQEGDGLDFMWKEKNERKTSPLRLYFNDEVLLFSKEAMFICGFTSIRYQGFNQRLWLIQGMTFNYSLSFLDFILFFNFIRVIRISVSCQDYIWILNYETC